MISARRFLVPILLALPVLAACGIALYLADGNLACEWRHNVVRNWEQYGFLTLKGKLVTNVGGYEALTKPEVYPGHRPACLYPAFFVKQLFAWTGAGNMAFYLVLSLAVLLSTWSLLGQNRVAWVVGAAAILCPGHTYYLPALDPNTIPVMIGLPFAAILLPQIVKPSLSPLALVGLLLLFAAYTALNWTTVFVHGMVLAYLLVARQVPMRRVGLYIALAGVNVLLVGVLSVLQKVGGGATYKASFLDFLGCYAWGAGGYGTYLTTGRAAMRLLFVGTAGMLPLILVCAYLLIHRRKSNPAGVWLSFLPLAVGVIGVGVMRNFFGHHPWIAACVFLVGLVLSIGLVVQAQAETSTAKEPPAGAANWMLAAFLAGCFVYAAAVTVMARTQNSQGQALVALLRTHTARSDTIVLVDADALLVKHAITIAEFADRRVVVVPDLSALEPGGSRAFLVSTSSTLQLPLAGQTSQPALASWPLVQKLLAFYSTQVSRRMAGNQGLRPGTCYLYQARPL
jgi:hypothetical protein